MGQQVSTSHSYQGWLRHQPYTSQCCRLQQRKPKNQPQLDPCGVECVCVWAGKGEESVQKERKRERRLAIAGSR